MLGHLGTQLKASSVTRVGHKKMCLHPKKGQIERQLDVIIKDFYLLHWSFD